MAMRLKYINLPIYWSNVHNIIGKIIFLLIGGIIYPKRLIFN